MHPAAATSSIPVRVPVYLIPFKTLLNMPSTHHYQLIVEWRLLLLWYITCKDTWYNCSLMIYWDLVAVTFVLMCFGSPLLHDLIVACLVASYLEGLSYCQTSLKSCCKVYCLLLKFKLFPIFHHDNGSIIAVCNLVTPLL